MDLDQFSYLWENPDARQWVLSKDKYARYSIFDLRDSEHVMMLDIEDEAIWYAVIQKMLDESVKVLTSEELDMEFEKRLPQDLRNLSDEDKQKLWESAQKWMRKDDTSN